MHNSNKTLLRKYIVLFSFFSPVCLLTILEEIYLRIKRFPCSVVFWCMSQGKDHYTFTFFIVPYLISRPTPAGTDWDLLCIFLWYVLCEILQRWSGVEIASYSANPAPGHQAAEWFSGASVDKQVACKEKYSCGLPCMKEHTLTTKFSSQLLPELVSLLAFEWCGSQYG